jgi:deoxyribodipyrimidine photo-lyase
MADIPWVNDRVAFDAWVEGRTGYPIVDAAMRQLREEGWVHNRARMIAASFLTKDLQIDWRWGEAVYRSRLIDADIASNNGGWQWTAGTGTDASPWFRIFNPVTQGKRFDHAGAYVRKYVPELAGVPDRQIHSPWVLTAEQQRSIGVVIGRTYPAPIVDHARAREKTLLMYRSPGIQKGRRK